MLKLWLNVICSQVSAAAFDFIHSKPGNRFLLCPYSADALLEIFRTLDWYCDVHIQYAVEIFLFRGSMLFVHGLLGDILVNKQSSLWCFNKHPLKTTEQWNQKVFVVCFHCVFSDDACCCWTKLWAIQTKQFFQTEVIYSLHLCYSSMNICKLCITL